MTTIKIIFGKNEHTLHLEDGSLPMRALTLFIEPSRLNTVDYTLRILSAQASEHESPTGIPISTLIEEGQVDIKLLSPSGEMLTTDPDMGVLNRIVLEQSPTHQSLGEIIVHDAEIIRVPVHEEERTLNKPTEDRSRQSPTDEEWARRSHRGNDERQTRAVRVRIWEDALRKARAHARAHPRYEVGGVCVGFCSYLRNSDLWRVDITDTFIGEHTVNRGASITFTPDTWSAAVRTIEKEYSHNGEMMLGWYHTHPSFGIFLSSYDLFFHENFFTQPWHVALVIDPIAGTEGFFAWNKGHTAVKRCADDWIEILPGRYERPPKAEQTATASGPSDEALGATPPAESGEMPQSTAKRPLGTKQADANRAASADEPELVRPDGPTHSGLHEAVPETQRETSLTPKAESPQVQRNEREEGAIDESASRDAAPVRRDAGMPTDLEGQNVSEQG